MSSLDRLLHRFVPTALRTADADTRRRARLVLAFTLALELWVPVFGVIYDCLGARQISIAVVLAGAFGLLVPAVLYATHSTQWAGNFLSLILFCVLAYVCAVTGGLSSPAIAWFVAVPIASTLLAGYLWGLLWLVVTVGQTVLFVSGPGLEASVLQHVGRQQYMWWELSVIIGILIVVTSLTLLYEKLKESMLSGVLGADRAKTEFLANMSHELRTPLTAILGFTDLLIDETHGPDSPADRLSRLQTIRRNGQYLLELINDVLDLSKVEAGKLKVETVDVSPVRLVNEVVSLMQVRADAKRLALSVELEGAVPSGIRTDPTRLRQILINLIGNAVKFTSAGSVRVKVRYVETGKAGPELHVKVSDTGVGLTREQLAMLFEPFVQAGTTGSREYGGTGLGLAISRRLARILGGDITASSVPGRGSTFRLSIAAPPAERAPAPGLSGSQLGLARRPGADGPAAPAGKRLRLLVAEDGPDNRQLIAFVLQKAGIQAVFVDNGRAAVDSALAEWHRGTPFDVVLMDMQMPVLDGYAAVAELRRSGYTAPVIALTAHAMAEDRQRCLASGCDDYAAKPIRRNELLGLVNRIVQRNESLVPA